MKRLVQLAWGARLAFVLTALQSLLAGLLTVGQAWLFSQIVNDVFLEGHAFATLRGLLVTLLGVIVLRAVLAWGTEISANGIATRVKNGLRTRLLAHIESLGPAYTTSERTGALTADLIEAVEALGPYYSQYLPQLVVAALVPTSILLFVLPLDALSAVVLLLTAPLIPLFMILIGKGAKTVTRRRYETLSRLSAHFLDSLQGLVTLKLFGRSQSHAQSVADASHRFRSMTLAVLRITFLSALVLELLATLSTAIIAVEVGLRLLYGRLVFKQALFLLVIAPEFYIPLRLLGLRFHAGMSGTSMAQRIFQILDTPLPAVAGGVHRLEGPMQTITLQDLSFTYPGNDRPALVIEQLDIQVGEHIALVGPSGAGKSTLFQLLLGFLQPQSGRILVNGQDLAGLDQDVWRARISWVSQTPYLFDASIADNIRLGCPGADLAAVQDAARAAHLDGLIEALPDGYQTMIGERGVRLSSGERQRLALARAFLKQADLILLDEPTAHLDPVNETRLHQATAHLLASGRTVITIAHRLETVTRADRVIVLEDGRVREDDSLSELLSRGGLYAGMLRQAQATALPVALTRTTTAGRPGPSRLPGEADILERPRHYSNVQVLRRLLSFLRHSWHEVGLSVLLSTATVASSIALMGTSAWLISAAALQPSVAELQVAIVGVRFFGIARGVSRYFERLASHGVTFRLLARLRTWFYRAIEPLAPARLQSYHSGDLLNRVLADVETLQDFYVRAVAPPLVATVITLGTGAYLAMLAEPLGLILPIFLFTTGVVLPLISGRLAVAPGRALNQKRAALRVALVDHVQGLADLLVFSRATSHRKEAETIGQEYEALQRRMAHQNGLQEAFNVLLSNLGMFSLLVTAIPLVVAGELDGRLLAAVALVGLSAFEAVTPLPQAAQMLTTSLEAGRRLFEVVDVEAPVKDPAHPRLPQRADVVLRDVCFRYPHSSYPALASLSLDLSGGKRIAIVGPSGAGKSTLVSLLLRFQEYEGQILLDNHPLRDYAQDDVRACFAVVPQNGYLFNATVRENLVLANPQTDQQALEWAMAQAQLDTFIRSLPRGDETCIGEMGVRLSSGQRQRLAVARALLKEAPILLLDEPTANLDPQTEKALLQTLFAVTEGRTTLWITHRLVDMERMDEIVVLDGGRIVERGSHKTLLERGGLYTRLWTLQYQHVVLGPLDKSAQGRHYEGNGVMRRYSC